VRALALLTTLVFADAAQSGRTIEILRTGSFHGDEVPANAPGRWFALVVDPSGASLRPVRVSVVIVRDEIIDEEGEKTGKRIELSPGVDPIVLVRGIPALKAGRVATALVEQPVDVGARLEARLRDRLYSVAVRCVEIPPVEGQQQERCDLLLRAGAAEQVLFSYGTYFDGNQRIWASERMPVVHWAGDIDGDGRLDLLLDTSDHYNVTEMRLYLSSRAKDGALVSEAAPFTATGC
jgi:hypothetical protein